ncbi:MAG: hypothetical protein FJZ05_00680 [Candidatus Nealsonbacteria bacterium]|nr:hypothetical protein [Candidatus Nealsonbacteria bacterium]
MKKKNQELIEKKIEKMFSRQTGVILDAVDEKVGAMGKRFNLVDQEISGLNKKLERMEIRINQKIDKLTTTLDKFLKRLTDIEDEFVIMKTDINRMKKVIREKLGVELL